MRVAAALMFVLAALPASAGANVVVDFAPPPGGAPWFADALEQLVAGELARFERVTVADTLDTTRCDREAACVVELYRAQGVNVVVLGALTGKELEYEVHGTAATSRPVRGALGIVGVSRSRLQQQIGDIVRPVVQLAALAQEAPAPQPDRPVRAPGNFSFVPLILAALVLWLCWPPLVLFLLLGRRAFAARPASWTWTAALIGAGALLLLALQVPWPPAAWLLVPTAGGILWGAFVLANLAWVFAPIDGLSRIRHDALVPLLQQWLAFIVLRASLLAIYAPLLLLTLLAAEAAQLDSWLTWVVAVPAAGLLAVFWLLSLVDNLSAWLDHRLVSGQPTARNPWHPTIRRYFFGYLRRGGIALDRKVLERALFLPGKLPGVVVYGGGLTRPRILIGAPTIELALGELPDEPEAPERTVNLEELPWGFVVPGSDQDHAAGTRTWKRRADAVELQRRKLVNAPPRPREPKPRLMGENATALGWVVPLPRDETLPLISNSKEDFDVVKSLLSEHYAMFESGLDDDVDDTDPTQKDFLFGALVRAVGSFTRADGLLSTLALAIDAGRTRASWLAQRLVTLGHTVHARFLSTPAAAVADAYAALNLALHPMIQHLHHLRGGDASVHTARADSPKLVSASKRILEGLGTQADANAERLRALSVYFSAPVEARRGHRMRNALVGLLLLALGAVAVMDAVNYHPIYVERMTQMQQKATAVPGGSDVGTQQER